MKLVRVIFAVFLVPVAVSAAFEQEGKPRWLAVTDSEPWAPTRISLVRSSDVCQEIVLSLPGVFVSAISATDGNQYAQLSVPGCGATADEVGLPEMPFKGFFLEIPYGVEVSIEILDQTTVRLGTGFKVHPLQPALPESGSKEPPAFQINEEAYATDAFFPANPVVIDDPGFLRGRRVVFVQVFPLRYNPATTELQAFASLRFKLAFSGDADRAGEARKQRLATLQWEALAERLILNYEPVIPSTGGFVRRLSTGDAADYLVIVKDNLYEEVLPLAEWKHKKGYITRVVRMSAVGSTADDVKSYIQDAYDTWTPAPSYVLLVGDSGDVPPDYYSDREYSCTTDHPFSCVDNSNPPFAPDYLPDLMLGRLPVHTETECTNVVNKILAYERTPDMGNWYDDVLIAAYFQDSDDNGVEDKWYMETCMTVYAFLVSELGWDGHTALCTTHWNPPHHETYRFRQDNYNEHRVELNQIRWGVSPYPNPVPDWIVNLWTTETQATADISSAVNWGVGNVLHRNHGSPTAWSHPHFDTGDISALNNGSRTPVVFSINCHTGSFHREGGDCFCEAFLKKSPGGCVGIVGATQSSPTKLNELLAHGIYTCFWPAEYDPDHTTIPQYPYSWCPAEALTYGKYYVFTYAGSEGATPAYFHMYHWFGDPEMKLRTATPQTLSVSHPSSVPHGQTVNITVTVTRSGSPVQDALVAISHPSAADHWSGLTNASGSITFSGIELTQTDDYDVVASAHNCIPYEGKINLCAAPSITTHPTSKTVCEGNSVTFSVGIGGSGSLSYQWRRNGSNISGATGSSYSINPVSTGHAGSYDVVVSNDCGQVFSNSATLTVQTGPTITSQPSSRTVCEGDSVTFSVGIGGSGSLSYQWRRNGSNISGATGSSYSINPVSTGHAGSYNVVVSNDCGQVFSNSATLTVQTGPTITSQPSSRTVCEGDSVTFSVGVGGSGSLSYQWRKNGSNISGATGSSYSINPVSTGHAGSYNVVVSNDCGQVFSNSATLTVQTGPTITSQPSSRTVCEGDSVIFSVGIGGNGSLSYQWRRNGSNISGATGSSYSINPVSTGHAGSYDVVVSNDCGQVFSSSATLTVQTGPTITTHPADLAICEGEPMTICVAAGGTGPLSYQWQKDGNDIPDENSSCYSIPSAATGDVGGYCCVISNVCSLVTSNTAALIVGTGPSILTAPADVAVCRGGTAVFTVTPDGIPPFSYQWRKDDEPIDGATADSLTIDPADTVHGGNYDVIVTDACGEITSIAAVLTVRTQPSITSPPEDGTVCEGDPITFTVESEGIPPFSYQWRKDDEPIPDATEASYAIDTAQAGDVGNYDVTITDACGAITSMAAVLTVRSGPAITSHPADQTVCEGDPATFTVVSEGIPPFGYQWRKDDEPIPGATADSYTIDPVGPGDGGNYDVLVADACGSATSTAAVLAFWTGPSISAHPVSQTVCEGNAVTFTITADGTPPLSYQWRKDDEPILGATWDSYTIDPVGVEDVGNYDVLVADACSTATSVAATLAVVSPGPGDFDDDCDVDLDDFREFQACLSGPKQAVGFVTPSQECLAAFDFGESPDDDIDFIDFAEFQWAFANSSR